MAEVGPEAEQHWEALQLLSINLERRWEAIVMQALQWQNRLKKELGEQQVGSRADIYTLHPGLGAAGSQLTHCHTRPAWHTLIWCRDAA